MRKNIDLPQSVVKELATRAKGERMKVKPYIEKILIEVAQKQKVKK